MVVASRSIKELEAVVEEVKAAHPDSDGLAVVADATIRDEAKLPVKEAIIRFGKIDILVSGAQSLICPDVLSCFSLRAQPNRSIMSAAECTNKDGR